MSLLINNSEFHVDVCFIFSLFLCFFSPVMPTITQELSLGILRSDYLAHIFADNAIKQVEINTIASSFGGISTYLLPLQRYIEHVFLLT